MLYKIYNGAVTFGNKTILEEINFEVKNQEHVAIVGRNGCGKTTLLRVICGEVELEDGLLEDAYSVTKLGNFSIGFMKQNAIADESITLLDEILKAYDEIVRVEKKLEKLSIQLESDYQEDLLNEYQDLCYFYQTIGGYCYQKEYELALCKFGFCEEDKTRKICEFSYGQRTKIAFLRLILSKPDLLLLDEPTNHLDTTAVEWLEEYLKNYPKAMVVVSHDRMFLDSVCNVTYAIEYGSLKRYSGNYSFYLKQRQIDYEKNLKDYEKQRKEIERLTRIVERFRYKPTKASMALSKLKQIERMVKLEKPQELEEHSFPTFLEPKLESYRNVLKVSNLKIGYDKVLACVDLELERGARLGIIGGNGLGKSTFLKTLIGELPAISGKYVFGRQVEIGYFDQNMNLLEDTNTVLEEMVKDFPMASVEELCKSLGAFEFSGDMVFQLVGELSGGQKVKLMLCKIMRHQPNVLILDEPTNHLDIVGRETIERLLEQYKGTVLFVSHDRYFVRKIATCLLVFEGREVHFYQGDYNYYLEKKEDVEERESISVVSQSSRKEMYVSTFKERSKLEKKIKRLEEEIDLLELQVKEYHQEMMKEEVYLDTKKMNEITRKLIEIENHLNEKMEVWEHFSLQLEK